MSSIKSTCANAASSVMQAPEPIVQGEAMNLLIFCLSFNKYQWKQSNLQQQLDEDFLFLPELYKLAGKIDAVNVNKLFN